MTTGKKATSTASIPIADPKITKLFAALVLSLEAYNKMSTEDAEGEPGKEWADNKDALINATPEGMEGVLILLDQGIDEFGVDGALAEPIFKNVLAFLEKETGLKAQICRCFTKE